MSESRTLELHIVVDLDCLSLHTGKDVAGEISLFLGRLAGHALAGTSMTVSNQALGGVIVAANQLAVASAEFDKYIKQSTPDLTFGLHPQILQGRTN